MNRLRWLLAAVIAIELAWLAVPVFRRLNSTRIQAPPLQLYHDSATARDLARLPDRFLFDSLEKWKELANAYLAYGHYAQADACLKAAQELDSQSPDVALQRGLCFERLGQLEPAREQFQKAAAGSRGLLSSRAWYHLGRLALRAEDREAATHAFEMAGETHWASVYQRAKLMVRGGQPESGEKLLKTLASQHPDDLHVWLLRSQALAAQGKTTEAIAANDRAQRSLSTLVFDDTELYLRPIRRQFGLVRDFAEAREGLRSGSSREAAESLAEALIADPLWSNCYLNVNQDAAELALQAGRPALAQTLLDRQITDLRFPSAKYWEVLGDLALTQGKTELATDAWQRSSTIS
ncbi:MAG: hypothetical protein EHM42_12805, partial [Planctomycetaceae bacterium]